MSGILIAYGYRCAVCGFDVRLGATPIAMEASHIKWKSYNGPSEEVNGLCLCVMHHNYLTLVRSHCPKNCIFSFRIKYVGQQVFRSGFWVFIVKKLHHRKGNYIIQN